MPAAFNFSIFAGMNVYLFNPDNDLALANYDANYRSPASARRMGQELTPLMGWLAENGDCLLFPERTAWQLPALYPRVKTCFLPDLTDEFEKDRKRLANVNYLRERRFTHADGKPADSYEKNRRAGEKPVCHGALRERFRNTVTEQLYATGLLSPSQVIPWGWNPGLIRRLVNAGMAPSLLPSAEQMEAIRQVSHRSLAVRVLRRVREAVPADVKAILCGRSEEVGEETELRRLIERSPEPLLLKAPLSGSGRGLIRADGAYVHPVSGWCRSTLEEQGSVMVEPYYDKVCDFAMEFYAGENGAVSFKGYSLFETNVHGSYTRNLLMTDRQILSRIVSYGFSESQLSEVRRSLEQALACAAGGRYRGYLGVDMMVCRTDGTFRLHPCVEVNARYTMGIFSRLFYDRYIKSGRTGLFRIRFSKSGGILRESTLAMQRQYPLVVENHTIMSGYLPLTPVDAGTQFVAEVVVE